jgi:hypothetical protein
VIRSIMTSLVYGLANYHTYKIGTQQECTSKPLQDVMHDILPDWSRYVHVRDLVLPLFFIPILFIESKQSFLFDLWNYFLIIVTLKAITIFFTFLPPSNPDCHTKKYINHCYHQIFSGHNSLVFLLYLLYIKHSTWFTYNVVLIAPVIVYSILILMTRAHYTVDILISYIIVFLIMKSDT